MAQIGTDIEYASALLSQGKLVAIPTDTIYGLAGNALDENCVRKIFEVKKRPTNKALIAQTNSLRKASLFLKSVPANAQKLAQEFWPGALTMVLPSNDTIPSIMIAGGDTIGVRIPNHPVALELLDKLDFPLAVSSANISSLPNPTTAHEVNEAIGDQIDYILDGGKSPIGIESTIIGFRDEKPVILRSGAISETDIMKVLGKD